MTDSLPLGSTDFATIRSCGEIYADKTVLIGRLAKETNAVFLARPRRFGKSLLISTLQSLFKDSTRFFEDLALEKTWQDKSYVVVRLDFSRLRHFENPEYFTHSLQSLIQAAFWSVGFRL